MDMWFFLHNPHSHTWLHDKISAMLTSGFEFFFFELMGEGEVLEYHAKKNFQSGTSPSHLDETGT